MSNKYNQLKTIFLESNTLGRLSIYIEFCDTLALNPNDATIDLGEGSSFWRKVGYPRKVFQLEKGINEGKKLYSYLKEEPADIVTSQVCEFEFLHILAERKTDLNLTRAGIPYRLRTKKVNRLFLSGLNEYNHNEIVQDLERFKTCLSNNEIEYEILEDHNGVFKDIYKVARVINKHILLGVMDSYIYASALLAESDELITYDRELKDISENLKESEDEFWKRIREKLLEDLRETVPKFRDLDMVTLPLGKKI